MLLGAIAVLLYGANEWHWPGNRGYAFAVYGALHAASLVATARASARILRKLGFIALAALASQLTLWFGVESRQLVELLPNLNGPSVLVGLYAFLGALVYGVLTRAFWMRILTHTDILMIAVGCLLASLLAVAGGRRLLLLSGWWVAVAWWLAFSAGLWYLDRQGGGAHDGHS